MPMPRRYRCARTPSCPFTDGSLGHPAWARAPWTEPFVDILGPEAPAPRYRTRAKMLWDDEALYIGADLEEPHVWGTLTEHDSVIFQDNDFELFLDPDGDRHLYAELEINALNTTWDLLLVRPYRDGGPPVDGWEIRGLRTAVHVEGTLNDPRDEDRGWSLEIAIPWEALREIAGVPCPPRPGDTWRINFSRVQWRHEVVDSAYRKLPGVPEDNWVWSPQGVVDMHRPERWGFLIFAEDSEGDDSIDEENWQVRCALIEVYERQREFRELHGRWARSAEELQLDFPGRIEATTNLWEAEWQGVWIDHEGRLRG